jgi:DNA-binding IclR family transcriptional regulator
VVNGLPNRSTPAKQGNRGDGKVASDPQFVTALSHGLAILRCFSPEQPVLTNGALARMTGMARSSVSRLTHTLVKLGYLDYDTGTGAYRIGLSVLPLQPAALAGTRLVENAEPPMRELADRIHGRVLLTVYDSFGLTVVHGVCTNPDIAVPRNVGSRYHIPRRAMGRAYIACCSDHEQEQILIHLAQGDDHRRSALHDEMVGAVRSYRHYGYCTSLSEIRPGNHSISLTLNLPHLGRRMILSCGGPSDLLPERKLRDRIAPLLTDSAMLIERISAQMPPARVQ